jgi:hypothetical protein
MRTAKGASGMVLGLNLFLVLGSVSKIQQDVRHEEEILTNAVIYFDCGRVLYCRITIRVRSPPVLYFQRPVKRLFNEPTLST